MKTEKFYIFRTYLARVFFGNKRTLKGTEAAVTNCRRLWSWMSFEEKKSEFIKLFKRDEKHSNRTWITWHHRLTGSCERGSMMFVRSNGIDLDGEMSTIEFLQLTQNEYNGEYIKQILKEL